MGTDTAIQRAERRLTDARLRLANHYAACPAGCTPTHIKCSWGWEYVGREEEAWWAAKGEYLAATAGGRGAP